MNPLILSFYFEIADNASIYPQIEEIMEKYFLDFFGERTTTGGYSPTHVPGIVLSVRGKMTDIAKVLNEFGLKGIEIYNCGEESLEDYDRYEKAHQGDIIS